MPGNYNNIYVYIRFFYLVLFIYFYSFIIKFKGSTSHTAPLVVALPSKDLRILHLT